MLQKTPLPGGLFDAGQRCNNCAHYYITHDANFRYGCRALDFKSQRQPILDVIEASGQPCHYFLKRGTAPL